MAVIILVLACVFFFLGFSGSLKFLYLSFLTLTVHHWFVVLGASFIAVYTIAFYYLKRHFRNSYKRLTVIHAMGNLVAFILISTHFGVHLKEIVVMKMHPATGVPLFISVFLLVITGFMMKFHVKPGWTRPLRPFHAAVSLAFFLIIVVHVLHGLMIF
jgi:hypothetical protein